MTYRRRRQRKPLVPIVDLRTHAESHVTVDQLAAWWTVDVQTIRKWVRIGRLPGYRFGRALRIRTDDALAFAERSRVVGNVGRGTLPNNTNAPDVTDVMA